MPRYESPQHKAAHKAAEALGSRTLWRVVVGEDHISAPVADLAQRMLGIGLTMDYRMSFNVIQNGSFVLDSVPDLRPNDFIWLCNRVGSSYRTTQGKQRIANRLCRAEQPDFAATDEYLSLRRTSSGVTKDVRVKNEQTRNQFWFGYNLLGEQR